MKALRFFTAIAITVVSSRADDSEQPNVHQMMMETTCKISGEGSTGSGFITGRVLAADKTKSAFVLVTANHVLTAIKGETAIVTIRVQKDKDHWERINVQMAIRKGGKDLWHKHNDVDLAAAYIALPTGVFKNGIMPAAFVWGDDKLREYDVSPGTELLCLGYPLGMEANPQGFPILRSGKIASYPLLPSKETKVFLFDFNVFEGNSGGPVYYYRENPVVRQKTYIGAFAGLVGIVTNQITLTQKVIQLNETREVKTPLMLGGVIPASFITELVDRLPEP